MNGSFTADEYRRTVWTPALSEFLSPHEVKANWQFCLSAFDILTPLKNPWHLLMDSQFQQLTLIVEQLQSRKPIQYIAGKAPFLHFWLAVNENTLIPRPETEELVLLIGKKMNNRNAKRILDIGTGSGCLAIGLQDQFKAAEVLAADVSEQALAIAKFNFSTHAPNIQTYLLNVLTDSLPEGLYDLIASNPPYIPISEHSLLERNVRDFEPHLALFTPNDDPLLFYRVITEKAKHQLSDNGVLAFETHFQYAEAVCELVKNAGFTAELFHDMQGLPRMVLAQRISFTDVPSTL